jgi:hypothetical protein
MNNGWFGRRQNLPDSQYHPGTHLQRQSRKTEFSIGVAGGHIGIQTGTPYLLHLSIEWLRYISILGYIASSIRITATESCTMSKRAIIAYEIF